jgi:hypothetical protein
MDKVTRYQFLEKIIFFRLNYNNNNRSDLKFLQNTES